MTMHSVGGAAHGGQAFVGDSANLLNGASHIRVQR